MTTERAIAVNGMHFEDFCQSIVSPALRAVAAHWHDVRGAKLMPSWEDIKPKAIAPYLPVVWAYRFDAKMDEFVARLAGDRITRAYGKSFRGLTLAELHPKQYQTARTVLLRVIGEPAVYLGKGRILQIAKEFLPGERLMLPLSSDGITGDGVFGATELGELPVAHQPVQGNNDLGGWFSLGAPAQQSGHLLHSISA